MYKRNFEAAVLYSHKPELPLYTGIHNSQLLCCKCSEPYIHSIPMANIKTLKYICENTYFQTSFNKSRAHLMQKRSAMFWIVINLFKHNASFLQRAKKETVESQQQWQPSWISVRLGRLGMKKAILASSHATAGSQNNRFILDFKRDSSLQTYFHRLFTSVKLKMMASSSIMWITTLRKRYAWLINNFNEKLHESVWFYKYILVCLRRCVSWIL